MPAPVSRYRLAWDPIARRGQVTFIAGSSSTPVRIPAPSAEEFNALALVLKEPNVVWDGRALWSDSATNKLMGEAEADVELFSAFHPGAKRIIDACEDEWPANKSDCSGFVRDVAAILGVSLTGQANEIVDQVVSAAGWTQLDDGKRAKEAADDGLFVVGGLKGEAQQAPSVHGHVVVVVSGPLAKDKYPTAYWGALGGVGEKAKTINWAWKAVDRDKVVFSSHPI